MKRVALVVLAALIAGTMISFRAYHIAVVMGFLSGYLAKEGKYE